MTAESSPAASLPPIAIVGISALFAGSEDLLSFWRDIVTGADRISDVPPSHWLVDDYYDADPSAPDKTYCKRGAFLRPIAFDPLEFGIPPNALAATDTAQLLALIAAKRALDGAARGARAVARDRISVVLGVASTTALAVHMGARMQAPVWRKAMREAGLPEREVDAICRRIAEHYTPWQESSFPGLLGNVVAGRIAHRLDLGGANFVTDAACASSLSALQVALRELYLGDSDLVLAGGVDALNDILMYMCFSKTPAFSPTGDCRPFSDQADGTLIGEGVGMVALRRLADAERDGNAIYAVVRGLGASSDGGASSVYAPRSDGQALALARAYEKAGYGPASVELVEAHGTGTKAGDAAELEGLTAIFAPAAHGQAQWCALGSVKSQIGHTKAAAGSAGLIKAALSLHHKILPPTIKVERPSPALRSRESPFYVNTQARPWIRGSDHPRRAAVSSFGFGGSNFHVTLEEYAGAAGRAPLLRTWPQELVLLCASSDKALAMAARALAEQPHEPLARIAHRCAEVFDPAAPARLALIADDRASLAPLAVRAADALEQGTAPELRNPDILFGHGPSLAGRVAFLFPGQGSQYVGMGAQLAMAFAPARSVWDMAADLAPFIAESLHGIVFPPPAFSDDERRAQETRLRQMANAQPAIAAASFALLRLVQAAGIGADAVAGHSFGEVTALAAAGVIPLPTLLEIAKRRGELMSEAAADQAGAMLAVAADAARLEGVLDLPANGLVIANDNAPGQLVLAGLTDAVGVAERHLQSAGMASFRLPVATALHSSLVAASCTPFAAFLGSTPFAQSCVPVYSNTTAGIYPRADKQIRELLAAQLAQPVRFRAMIETMYADGITRFVEVGPGRVLTDLVDRCLAGRPHLAVALDDKKARGLRAFWRGLGRMAVSGSRLDLAALAEGYALPDAPRQPPAHAVMISGANVAKPYPPAGGAAALPAANPEAAPPLPAMPPAAPPVAQIASGTSTDFARFQYETLLAHRQYQDLMAQSHKAFLEMATALLPWSAGTEQPPLRPEPDRVLAAAPSAIAVPLNAPVATPPSVAPPPSVVPPPHRESPRTAEVDTARLVLEVVAEKTGYPVDMLGLDMEMAAGLGIDSIKQVEILAALQQRLPNLPELTTGELARLTTLRDVVVRLGSPAAQTLTAPASHVAAVTTLPLLASTPRAVTQAVPGSPLAALARRPMVHVTDEHPELARALAEALREQHLPAEVVPAAPDRSAAVISLAGLAPGGAKEPLAAHLKALAAARAVARYPEPCGRLLVTVQSTGGDFGLSGADARAAWLGGVAGVLKTAAREWPGASLKAIDVADPATAARTIVRELCAGGDSLEVAFGAAGERRVIHLESVAVRPSGAARLSPGAVVVVSGGARGVTAHAVARLAALWRLRLAILGRSDVQDWPQAIAPTDDVTKLTKALAAQAEAHGQMIDLADLRRQSRLLAAKAQARAGLEALRAAGIDARYSPVDITDAAAVAHALDEVRARWGAIAGVIHGAGVLADKLIADMTEDQFAQVFRTKVAGLAALLSATRTDPLQLIVLFSSIAARTGNVGQAAYAAANEVLNKVAAAEARERGEACIVRSYNWGPWDGGMVDGALKTQFGRQGVALIPLEAGARFLCDDLAAFGGPVETVVLAGD